MTQQESEDREVPQGSRKKASTRAQRYPRTTKGGGGGKAVPVTEVSRQLLLPFATAENPLCLGGADGDANRDGSCAASRKVPKAKGKLSIAGSARMEEVVECLDVAFDHVAANQGVPGIDGQTIEMVRADLPSVLARLKAALLNGSYLPQGVMRVWIPKASGGERGLGIPTVVDRVVQEALRLAIEPTFEPTFHPSSHGFRPNRGCHTAIAEACGYVQEGYTWLVDIDLKSFLEPSTHCPLVPLGR